MKNFDYGYAPTLYKNDIILNDYIPEVKPVRGMFVDDLSQPIDYNPIYVPPPYIDYPPTEPPQTINPKFYYSIFIDDMPPPVEQPIEQPIEMPIAMPIDQPQPINPKVYYPLFIDDMPPPVEQPSEMPAKSAMPTIQPISLPETLRVETSTKSNERTPSGIGGVQNASVFVNDSDISKSLPTKKVSKNLKPYIYAGLGIVAILIVSRILTKK